MVSALASINEVNQRRARLVLRRVTVCGFNSRCGTFISVCGQPPASWSTQPGHPFLSRRSEYQPNGDDALRLGSKGRYGSCEGWQVKLCDHLVTHGPYLSALAVVLPIRRYTNNQITQHRPLNNDQTHIPTCHLPYIRCRVVSGRVMSAYTSRGSNWVTPQPQGIIAIRLVLTAPAQEGMARLS